MMRWLALAALLLILSGCDRDDRPADPSSAKPADAAAEPSETGIDLPGFPEGFRGLAWGDDRSLSPDLEPVAEASGTDETAFFTRPGEPLELDGLALRRVLYGFVDDRLEQVVIVLERPGDTGPELKTRLFRSYGPVGPFVSSSAPLPQAESSTPEQYREYRWILPGAEIGLLMGERGTEPVALLALGSGASVEP